MNNDFLQQITIDPMETTVGYYASCLDEKALAFLAKNCLCADSSLRVGFSDRTIGKQIPSNQRVRGRNIRKLLQNTNILKETGHETFRGHVTVPLTGLEGNVTGIYGMRIDRHGAGEPIVRIGQGIFNAAALRCFEEIIVCHDPLDAWSFYAAGHKNAIAAANHQLKREHFASVKRVLLAHPNLDCDPFDGLEIMRINFPDGVSVNQYAIENRTMHDALGTRIRAASWVAGAPKAEPTKPQTPVASPVPSPVDEFPVQRSETEVTIHLESRRWRIRGLERNKTLGVMKVNVMVFHQRTERFHVDTLDLYHARSRRLFLKQAAEEIGESEEELRSDLGRVLLKLEELQVEQHKNGKHEVPEVEINDADRCEALKLLNDERLLDRILDDFDACGIVGERIGKLTGYLAATSRLLDKPLGIVIQSSSAAGKTSLMEAILSLMPHEQQFACSAMTSQSLYYAGNLDLRHKILGIAEEQGVRDASYALKLLQSEGKLSIVATGKESGTGRTAVERYEVEGPVSLLLTTTASDVDPELMNRCFVLSVDEQATQTGAIQSSQRDGETLDAMVAREKTKQICKLHQNAQRLLRPLQVVNPYARQLTFTSRSVRNRRDHAKYLALIRAIAFLHQYQRQVKQKTIAGKTVKYIEVSKNDIGVANMIADSVLGTSIDELPQQTRKLLLDLDRFVHQQTEANDMLESEVRFTRRQVREQLGWGGTALRVHLERLCRWEYVVPHGGGRGRLTEYELLFDGRGYEGQPTLCGLVDPSNLTEPAHTPSNVAVQNRCLAPQKRVESAADRSP